MIDGALRTMIDEVLMELRKMSGPAVAPALPKRHFSLRIWPIIGPPR